MISKILTASVLALSLSAGAFSVSAYAAEAGTGGAAASGSSGNGDNGGAAADPGANGATGGTGAADNSGTGEDGQKNKMMRMFYTDDSMKTMRTQEEINTAYNSMDPTEQAALRGNCDSDATMKDMCSMLPPKK